MQFVWLWIDDLVGKGLSGFVIAELMYYVTLTLIPMSLPMTILLSSIMLFGNLGENNELLAFKSAGISLFRIMRSLIITVVLICALAFFFSNNVLPFAQLKMKSLLRDIKKTRTELLIQPQIFNNNVGKYSIKVSDQNPKTKMMYNVMIYDHTADLGNQIINLADSGKIHISSNKKYLVIELYNGKRYEDKLEPTKLYTEKTYPTDFHQYKYERILHPIDEFGLKRSDESVWKGHRKMLSVAQLSWTIDSLNTEVDKAKQNTFKTIIRNNLLRKESKKDSLLYQKTPFTPFEIDSLFKSIPLKTQLNAIDLAINFARASKNFVSNSEANVNAKNTWLVSYIVEWHKKFTLSVACLILFFIGAPLGAIIRKGGLGMPVIVSIIFFLIYYVISTIGEKVCLEGNLPAWAGMWASSIILFPIGLFFTYKASRDSNLFNIHAYTLFLNKIKLWFNKRVKK